MLLTDSGLVALRGAWARLRPGRVPRFQLPLPEGWDDTERLFLETVFGALGL
jgi:hypothetical protein